MMMPMMRPPAVEIDHRFNSRYRDVRFPPNSGAKADVARRRGWADTVAKVENRTAPKISRKLIFGRLRRCVAFQRH